MYTVKHYLDMSTWREKFTFLWFSSCTPQYPRESVINTFCIKVLDIFSAVFRIKKMRMEEFRNPNCTPYRPISNWEGIPNDIDDALKYTNGYTYFFKDGNYYRFDDRAFKVPLPTNHGWHAQCVEMMPRPSLFDLIWCN